MADHRSTTPKLKRDSWSTPQYIFDWLNSNHNFDVDLAADASNSKVNTFYSVYASALDQDWHEASSVGFCNPPYSSISPWVKKAIDEAKKGFTTVMLIPTPNGESYYQNLFDNANELIFITGRLSFVNYQGDPQSGNTRGSCVAVFRPKTGFERMFNTQLSVTNVMRDSLKARYQNND